MIRLSLLFAMTALAQQPALRQGVSVQMCVSRNAVAVPDADAAGSLIVAVTARGDAYLEVSTVTPEQLTASLKPDLAAHPGKRVYVKVDARTAYEKVAPVLAALRTAGVTAPILLTSQKAPPGTRFSPPMGLEVLLTKRAGQLVELRPESATPFADVVQTVDLRSAEGATVYMP